MGPYVQGRGQQPHGHSGGEGQDPHLQGPLHGVIAAAALCLGRTVGLGVVGGISSTWWEH